MISIQDLLFFYDADGFRLQVDELDVSRGERVALMGASGSGKTTLLHIVAGILQPNTGCVRVGDTEITRLNDAERRDFRIANVGLVFQEFELLEYLSVLENVLLAYRINSSFPLTTAARENALALIADVGLANLMDRLPTQLSQGQRQRVAVCRALATNPRLVLADEPTANLDALNREIVLEILDSHVRNNSATLVVVTHDDQVSQRMDTCIDISSWSVGHGGSNHDA